MAGYDDIGMRQSTHEVLEQIPPYRLVGRFLSVEIRMSLLGKVTSPTSSGAKDGRKWR